MAEGSESKGGDAAGLRSPKQRRSHAGYDRLLAAARQQMATRDFDAISIRDITTAADCSIGSFYYRFGTKAALFRVLIDDMIDRRLSAARKAIFDAPFDEIAEAIARGALLNQRASAGLLRSAVKKHLQGEGSWHPFETMGQVIESHFRDRIAEHRGHAVTAAEAKGIQLAFAWLYGLLLQGVLGLNVVGQLDESYFEEDVIRTFSDAIARALAGQPSRGAGGMIVT